MSICDAIYPNDFTEHRDFYALMESCLDYIRKHDGVTQFSVTPQQADKYRGDFHGLLDSLSIDKKLHYLITRLNGMKSSLDYDGRATVFNQPPVSVTRLIFSQYKSEEA